MDSVTPPISASNAGTPISQNVASRAKSQPDTGPTEAIRNDTISDTIETTDRECQGGLPWSSSDSATTDSQDSPVAGDQLDLSI